ncbi:hypothetical protein Poli38472_007781 [Pythium oligandrum]|uniref:Elicitin-like protein n=1 Tax=Pythium oligandrum TaxID=41045 RepID=A0A8K1CR74_PYTOL|nr:hypothetical protein Poli38472_007781 [Pythium oligandrum]|eukprot:TMW68109.1 hypothetical protein Poli38472_007781 [Pythium oligandrum]
MKVAHVALSALTLGALSLETTADDALKVCTAEQLATLDAMDSDTSVDKACSTIKTGTLDCSNVPCVTAMKAMRAKMPECIINGAKSTLLIDLSIVTCDTISPNNTNIVIPTTIPGASGSSVGANDTASSSMVDLNTTDPTPAPTPDSAERAFPGVAVIMCSSALLVWREAM